MTQWNRETLAEKADLAASWARASSKDNLNEAADTLARIADAARNPEIEISPEKIELFQGFTQLTGVATAFEPIFDLFEEHFG